jgi:hypothetical protein
MFTHRVRIQTLLLAVSTCGINQNDELSCRVMKCLHERMIAGDVGTEVHHETLNHTQHVRLASLNYFRPFIRSPGIASCVPSPDFFAFDLLFFHVLGAHTPTITSFSLLKGRREGSRGRRGGGGDVPVKSIFWPGQPLPAHR